MPIYQVTIEQSQWASVYNNVIYYESTSTLDFSQLVEVADEVRSSYAAGFYDYLAPNWAYTGIIARRVDSAGLPSVAAPPTAGDLSGAAAGTQAMAAQVAILGVGTAVTTYPRSVRTYHGGMVNSSLGTNGLWASALRDAFDTWLDNIDSVGVTGDTLLRVAAQWTTVGSSYVDDWNRIEAYRIAFVPATQRRRRINQGI